MAFEELWLASKDLLHARPRRQVPLYDPIGDTRAIGRSQ